MTRLPKEEKPTYVLSYPRRIRLARTGAIVLLVGVALVRWVLAWVHFVGPLFQGAELAAQPWRPLVAAHVSLLLAVGVIASVYAFLPNLAMADEGLAVRTLRGWQVVPWATVTAVRFINFEESRQRLVLVQGRWARWSPWPRLVSMCLGAGFESGILITSAIRDFKPLMRRLYREVTAVSPEVVFDQEFFSLPARLALEPAPTLAGLIEQAQDEGWALALSAQAMAAVALGLVVTQGLVLLLAGGAWWKPLALIAHVAGEWLIGTLYLYAVAEFFPGDVQLREAVLLYPLTQVPRALLTVPMAMFVAVGAPFVAALVGLVGVLWAVMLTARLIQRIHRLQSILPALAGGSLQALYQFIALAFIFSW